MSRIVHQQESMIASPWSLRHRCARLAWEATWTLLCSWTPKPLNAWRIWVLRRFGARIQGRPFVHQRSRILVPWNVQLDDLACVGDGAVLYSLGTIRIGARATIAQEAYLCTGTHDFSSPIRPLVTEDIEIGADAFVGARAFIMPGVSIGEAAIVGACSVVTRPVAPGVRVVGNPARPLAGSVPVAEP